MTVPRRGFTLIELVIAGAIIGVAAFAAVVGVVHITGFVEKRGELMAADGYCWDVAWKLFNEDYATLQSLINQATEKRLDYYEIWGKVLPATQQKYAPVDKTCDFLSHLQYPGSPPVCYVTLSNRVDSTEGLFIGVNLEWGPAGQRRIMVRRASNAAEEVFGPHPIEVFRSNLSRVKEGE